MIDILKITIYFLVLLKTVKCCDCNLEEMIKDTAAKNPSVTMEKRQMHEDDDDDSAEAMRDSETTEEPRLITERIDEIYTEELTTKRTNDMNTVKKVLFKSTETTSEERNDINDECSFFKDMKKFNFEKMVDVWKIAFYKTSETLACFKIHIKKITEEDRKTWQNMFGDFNGTIDWKNCIFEVASSALKNGRSEQRHFLEGSKHNWGVFKNVIVTREESSDIVTLLDQSPDQWLVINNLLLMRDCDNGDVVVFSRLPMEPSLRDMDDALTIFGEDTSNGTLACETLRDPKYQTLS